MLQFKLINEGITFHSFLVPQIQPRLIDLLVNSFQKIWESLFIYLAQRHIITAWMRIKLCLLTILLDSVTFDNSNETRRLLQTIQLTSKPSFETEICHSWAASKIMFKYSTRREIFGSKKPREDHYYRMNCENDWETECFLFVVMSWMMEFWLWRANLVKTFYSSQKQSRIINTSIEEWRLIDWWKSKHYTQ